MRKCVLLIMETYARAWHNASLRPKLQVTGHLGALSTEPSWSGVITLSMSWHCVRKQHTVCMHFIIQGSPVRPSFPLNTEYYIKSYILVFFMCTILNITYKSQSLIIWYHVSLLYWAIIRMNPVPPATVVCGFRQCAYACCVICLTNMMYSGISALKS